MRLCTNIFKKYLYNFSTSPSSSILEHLTHRSLIRLSGNDSAVLLQGLITNDMQHLSKNVGSMFAMFLNNKGRILYDTIIYRIPAESTYLLEVDNEVVNAVKKHLNVYRLRRKVDIISIDDEYKVWVHFSPSANTCNPAKKSDIIEGRIVPCTTLDETAPVNNVTTKQNGPHEILIFRDPRLALLGSRLIVPTGCEDELEKLFGAVKGNQYRSYRYQLGVGEGVKELPPGNSFPLEANCDYLHGVSFHKGCYIGQELTARTHHTGVIRKRLMPLLFERAFETKPAKDEPIKAGELNVGKLRGYEETNGLGLLRINEVLKAEKLTVNNTVATTSKPNWWPVELAKEKISQARL